VRTLGIWVFGLLASLFIGAMIGSQFDHSYSSDMGVSGAIAGMLAFTCLRLWLGQSPKDQS
jgi:hypothetical protein